MLKGKHILVGISGGIAAYKIPELIRLLTKAGAEVQVTTTKNALEFVTCLTLQTLSGHKVYSDVFAAINEHSTEHISLPDWADMMIVAPATANVIGKMSAGIADDALTTTFAAMRKPVVIAPAMNDKMYAAPATQEAIRVLSSRGNITMLDCAEGPLACGTTGKGRMQEADVLLAAVEYALSDKPLQGRRVLITAGPTHEAIDPVRYISNASTGKMGYALARVCLRMGAEVTVVSGPTNISMHAWEAFAPLRMVNVSSAREMAAATVSAFAQADITILCAAVADFTPAEPAVQKIKKQPGQTALTLQLQTTQDIAATLGDCKRDNQVLVGFALETNNEVQNATRKMQSKHLDMIVLNSLQDAGAGFGTDTNQVTLLYPNGTQTPLPLATKDRVAEEIIEAILHSDCVTSPL